MGCLPSKNERYGENQVIHDKPLQEWTAEEVEAMLRSRPALVQYASTALQVHQAVHQMTKEDVNASQGTAGAVLIYVTDDILREAGNNAQASSCHDNKTDVQE